MNWSPSRGVQAVRLVRGLRRLVRDPVTLEEARQVVTSELARRNDRFLAQLDILVWPYAHSPTRRLLEIAGYERGDVVSLVRRDGLEPVLERLRDDGVYVSYEEYQGSQPLRRGSTTISVRREDFFNPVVRADYMASTSGSRSAGTAMEVSFAYQRRKATTRRLQMEAYDIRPGGIAIWLPVLPSAAGFSAVMVYAAAGNNPARWFSQIPVDVGGIAMHKRLVNRSLPTLAALTRPRLPSPQHVPSSQPSAVVDWLAGQLGAAGRVAVQGYASSLTAVAHDAMQRGLDLTGVVAIASGEPITTGKLRVMRSAGMTPAPAYAFTPEGIVGTACPNCPDDEYHLWEHELAVVSRRRARSDGVEVDALLFTSLSREAPRVLVNVENDDFARVRRGEDACVGPLGALGMRTRISGIRGMSKVVAGGVSVNGELLDQLVDTELPQRLGGRAGDYQFVELDQPSGTRLALRVHPQAGPVDEQLAGQVVREALRDHDNGVLADEVWESAVAVIRTPPVVTGGGKLLAIDRLGTTRSMPT